MSLAITALGLNFYLFYSCIERVQESTFEVIHFCLTYNQSKGDVIIKFLNDLRECCKQVCQLPDKGKESKTAALYGMAAQIPDKTIIEDVAHLYLDACYSMPTKA
ncbi:unnamed protein product [Meloidogyne enterolobii]|uniref:Uncharacterized protein n=1 Tax=Meloidogyne enterolobii TaxID=390850 RepID=A0ACB0Y6L8_MELEN